MKYLVRWTENHNSVVEAESEEEAVELAQSLNQGDTFYDLGSPTVSVVPDPDMTVTAKKFFYLWKEPNGTIYTYDILGASVDLYTVGSVEEAREVCDRLNKAIHELMGDDS